MSFHFGLPSAELLLRVNGWGAKVLSSATTVEESLWLEEHGVDAVIAQGVEAGGHRGMFLTTDIATQLGTFALLPQVLLAVKVPVIGAGGIADARAVAAAMAMGAAGVQVGTAYLLCPEVTTSSLHRAALKNEAMRVTALTNLFTGRPARGIVKRVMRELGPMSPLAPDFPLAAAARELLHHEVRVAGGIDPEVVDRHDGRMLEPALHPRLAKERRHRRGIAKLRAHQLHHDVALDPRVARVANFAHAATGDLGADRVPLATIGIERERRGVLAGHLGLEDRRRVVVCHRLARQCRRCHDDARS